MMRIVVDAMGSDDHPGPDVEGAVMAARDLGVQVVLVGDKDRIGQELAKHNHSGLPVEVVHASEAITMTDKPADSAKNKQDSSMHVGMRIVKAGDADAFVSAGNTGAILAVGTLQSLGRIKGVRRPALAALFQNYTGWTILCDFGANSDCRPDWLTQFATMADLYAKLVVGLESPRVALLSNGEEEGKGNDLVRETHELIQQDKSLNYVGAVEPKEVLMGETDVVVADGFVGNVMGKSLEAMASLMTKLIRDEITSHPVSTFGGLLVRPAFKRARSRLDPEEIGGIPLLGLNGLVIVAHGRSNAVAMKSAIRQARDAAEKGLVQAITEGIRE